MSQFAELTACQIPLKSGLPSFVRGARYGWACVCAWDGVGIKIKAIKTPKPAIPAMMLL
jgi:hypothetical protein